ncbi:hypothetical protein [Sphingobium boeckii]|uniref:Lipoprotein n=1 Tax=Sphingobium boeckii TaxID=1082345 RepID=A0A7W9AGP1_9SPHN|nr:hypothetical protein [Sphingobium boeckii]MBB5685197.1 hypothetical protein [Sphingobium boeckii]
MRLTLSIAAATLLLAGCGAKTDTADNVAVIDDNAMAMEDVPANEEPGVMNDESMADAPVTDAWIGKWTGPEGLALDIAKTEAPGSYKVTVNLLDGAGSYAGTADGDVITFMRAGIKETIRAATGDETGLKYLAGKPNCLMIKQAEGFCRG